MALTVGELVARIDADGSGFDRGLSDAELRMAGFQRDTEGRLRTMSGRFASMGEQIAAGLRSADEEGRRFGLGLDRLGGFGGKLAGIAVSAAGAAAKLGTAAPAAAGLAAAVGQVAPAAGLAVSGLIAVQLATKTFQIGMQGVGEAVKTAMDTANPEAFAEAMKKLSPAARGFAMEVRTLAPEFKALQQGVQQRMFAGLAGIFREMGGTTLPVLKAALFESAGALNLMGRNIGNTAVGMSKSGVLGQALAGATDGLKNLSRIPSQVMLGLTQVGAAAAPAFARLTGAAGGAADRLSEAFTRAFESGAMERAIEQALAVLKQLGSIAGNVFSVVGSIFTAAQASGGGFLGVLQQVTASLAAAFKSPEVQTALKGLFSAMAEVGRVAGPLLVDILKIAAGVLTELAGPAQIVIRALGDGLRPVVQALGPVLASAARAFGALVVAASPLLVVAGQLIAALLPALTPLLDACTLAFQSMAPLVQQVATTLLTALAPVLAQLPSIVGILAQALVGGLAFGLQLASEVLAALGPSLVDIGKIFGELLVALAPLLQALAGLTLQLLSGLLPAVRPLIKIVGDIAAVFANALARTLNTVVIPAIQMVVSVLKGDFGQAWDWAKKFLTGLPAMAVSSLGDLGGVLWRAGQDLIGGLIGGLRSMFGGLKEHLGWVTRMLPKWKGPEDLDARLLTPAGRSIIEGFQRGIQLQTPGLRDQLNRLTQSLPQHVGMEVYGVGGPGLAAGGSQAASATRITVELAGPEDMKRLIREIVARDGGDVQRVLGQRV
ncbi:hypothetical protein [Streptomyces globosus]|uniref:hypothetical protein n=1 Tax=Streptomyces globosus TaxID=68209 RepID=UPI003625DE55